MPSNYYVIIGDIKKSRHVDNWTDIFKQIRCTLKETNRTFSSDIFIDFKSTVGDEFQGVLKDPQNAYVIYLFLRCKLPVEWYCGIGIGDIEKPLKKDIGMRGTAFYRARSALELCKKSRRKLLIKSLDISNQRDEIINILLQFVEVLEDSWTKRQQEVVNYFRLHPDYTYEQLGKHFKISKRAVSQILKAAGWNAISEGEVLVNKLLRNISSGARAIDVKPNNFTNKSKANILYRDEHDD
ncbi:MAG: SatD family protein [Candidatus Cloacimonadia bacterium]